MRITQNMMTRTVLTDLQGVTDRLSQTQQRLSSGKQILQPSDDPFGTSQALLLRGEIASNTQYQRNVNEASSWQDASDTALSKISDAVLRARDLLIQGANGTADPSARASIAAEINQLIDEVKSEGNTEYAGRYVFAGSKTTTQPYQLGGVDSYSGNTEVVKREIGPGVQVDLNIPGSSVIGDGSSGIIKVLRDISNDLTSNNSANLQNTDIAALDSAHDQLVSFQATVGARSNRLTTALSRLQELSDTSSKLLSQTEDADMSQTIIDYSTQQAVYQAALKSGANLIQPSLMDFLSS
jgi:flagellar hook-associated protein 3 FlgL